MQKMVKFQYTSTENVCQTMSTLYVKKTFHFYVSNKNGFYNAIGNFSTFLIYVCHLHSVNMHKHI